MANDGNILFSFQAYNLFNLYDTIKWAADIGVLVHANLVDDPEWCSILCIPKEIRDKELYAYGVYQIEADGLELFEYIKGDQDSIMGLPIKDIINYINQYKK